MEKSKKQKSFSTILRLGHYDKDLPILLMLEAMDFLPIGFPFDRLIKAIGTLVTIDIVVAYIFYKKFICDLLYENVTNLPVICKTENSTLYDFIQTPKLKYLTKAEG